MEGECLYDQPQEVESYLVPYEKEPKFEIVP